MNSNKIELTQYEKEYMRVLDKLGSISDSELREKATRLEARRVGNQYGISPFVLMKEFRACFRG